LPPVEEDLLPPVEPQAADAAFAPPGVDRQQDGGQAGAAGGAQPQA